VIVAQYKNVIKVKKYNIENIRGCAIRHQREKCDIRPIKKYKDEQEIFLFTFSFVSSYSFPGTNLSRKSGLCTMGVLEEFV
jgi:hypothetical protein